MTLVDEDGRTRSIQADKREATLPRFSVPLLLRSQARALLDAIDPTTPGGLRDRALIGLMVYGFARVGAALAMRVEDVYVQNRRLWVRLREKGGKPHALPCHHTLEDYLVAYLDGAGLRGDPKGPLFRTLGRGTGRMSERPLPQASAHAMVRRRAAAAGIATPLGCHSFRATGITAYPLAWTRSSASASRERSLCQTPLA
ncbi:tyrosine-type recombinase/integrase [Azospirillum brasilense]|uniref:tyrosine-type recombinase/integrase n=1 Tax=Azospirillum brasilense TaxID=192 RepID=UPI001FFEBFDD|nr:tyrosine-type recombinase/integrase [Azospirillum brasilense]